jgi:hypothetical protein
MQNLALGKLLPLWNASHEFTERSFAKGIAALDRASTQRLTQAAILELSFLVRQSPADVFQTRRLASGSVCKKSPARRGRNLRNL